MTEKEAWKALEDVSVVPAITGGMREIRELADKCLAEDIPVLLNRCAGKG